MPRQRTLNFDSEQVGALWKQLPEGCRKEAVAIWARVIALAVQASTLRKGARDEASDRASER